MRLSFVSDGITVIPFIHHGVFKSMVHRELCKHLIASRHITAFTSGQPDSDPGRLIDTAGVDVGGKAPARTSPSLCRLPAVFFNAPAAC